MHVVATAGHVDHGKSMLARVLTGMEPDRFAEERRRGMTIDLGYAWTRIDGDDLALVDVPGHERFIATMLAGLGPAPAVMFVVGADEGWRRQSAEHLAAVDALGLTAGLLVVTRSDLADPARAMSQGLAHLAESSLGPVEAVAVSSVSGRGIDELRSALGRLVRTLPEPEVGGRVRLWLDRSFTIKGAGTVVTGTLGSGTLTVGDSLQLGDRTVRVRGLQSLERDRDQVTAVARVAINLRGVDVAEVSRGDALLTPGAWHRTTSLDVRLGIRDRSADELAGDLMLHLGTAGVPARVRPLGNNTARITLSSPLPAEPGDRLVLRDPGRHEVAAGAAVLDSEPPTLRRRGAAAARGAALADLERARPATRFVEQVRRRGIARRADLEAAGVSTADTSGVDVVGDWLIDREHWTRCRRSLVSAVDAHAQAHPLDPRLSAEAARQQVELPDRELVLELAREAGLAVTAGRIARAGSADAGLGAAEAGLALLAAHLADQPFAAPEKPDLDRWGLGVAELAAAERTGRVIRLSSDLVLLPTGPALAMRALSALRQPFTMSEARQELGTTRRVAVPLLEFLDRKGWTERVDAEYRRVRS